MNAKVSGFSGPERRHHRMFVTRNTEYHFRDELCVAVRDRRSGKWLASHLALHRKLSGAVRFHPNGTAVPIESWPNVGQALYFSNDGRELVTSLLCAIERPRKSVVSEYGVARRADVDAPRTFGEANAVLD